MDIVDELKKLSDKELEEIYIKGENLHIPMSKASTAKRILDSPKNSNYLIDFPQFNIPIFTVPNIGNANASLSALSNIGQSLNSIADIYSNMGVAPATLAATLLGSIESIQKIAGTSVWQGIANNAVGSPILDAVSNIQKLNIQTLNEKRPQDLLPKKLAKEITSVSAQKVDKIYNFPAYNYIFNMEVYLRSFITKYIIQPNREGLASKIPQEMLDKWEEKRKIEEENLHIDHIKYDSIEYSDFTDLKIILEKRTTISLVKNVISETNLKTITSKLTELKPIRIKIAHSRALTEDEFNTIKIYSDKIKKVLRN